jgi:hypothetical protein
LRIGLQDVGQSACLTIGRAVTLPMNCKNSRKTLSRAASIDSREDCRILAGEALTLELSGPLPSEAVVTWDVDYGEVVYLLPGSNVVLIAPATPSVITVYATITGTKPGRWVYVNRQCLVSQSDIMDG